MTQSAIRAKDKHIESLVMISSIAYSISNFRGPLIKDMVRLGVKVYALAPDYDERTRTAVRGLGAEPIDFSLERTGMHVARDLRDAVRLTRLLRTLKPDAVFCYFIKPVVYGSLAARLAGVPYRYALVAGLGYVYTQADGKPTVRRRALQALASMLYWLAFKFCRRVFLQNQDDMDFFLKNRLIAPSTPVCIGASGVELDDWPATPQIAHPPTFLLMARMLREKGIAEYVEAARIVRRRHSNARFLLLGGLDPNPGGLAQDEIAAWAADGTIEWFGHVADVRTWIAQSSVYVLPSYREGKPRSTQEAMAMARPIITTDVPGCRDTVVDGVNGFLVPARNPEALARAMMRFIDEPRLIQEMGIESRRLAEKWFDARKINRLMLNEMGILSVESGAAAAIAGPVNIPAQASRC